MKWTEALWTQYTFRIKVEEMLVGIRVRVRVRVPVNPADYCLIDQGNEAIGTRPNRSPSRRKNNEDF